MTGCGGGDSVLTNVTTISKYNLDLYVSLRADTVELWHGERDMYRGPQRSHRATSEVDM